MCFLDTHHRKYNLSTSELLLSLATVSGAAYAKRHWELSQNISSTCVWGHRIIAAVEALPVLGALAALIEKLTFLVKENFFQKPCATKKTPQTQLPLTSRMSLSL